MTATLRLDPWTLRPRNGGGLRSMPLGVLPPRLVEPQPAEPRVARRTRIWELSSHLHCSIVGTCLSTGELRQVLAKAQMAVDGVSEHEVHGQGVLLAGLRDGRAKLMHKAIDKRHRTAIGRFEQARTVDEVRSLWRQTVERGEIPGGYWAAMTHPATDAALIREIFGEVHMLSHLVGAANRADIRRLAELEAENRALRDKLARQQDQLHDGIVSRDAKIHELNGLLARRIANQQHEETADQTALTRLVADLDRRLRRETGRHVVLEERLARVIDTLGGEREWRVALERRERVLSEELQAVEASLGPAPEASGEEPAPSLTGLSLLYVGGRTDRLGHLRALSERLGVSFLHHDGGIDDRNGLLGGLVSRADLVMFPVDCVSHEAVTVVKRLCRQMSKPFMPLRGSGMGSFAAALGRVAVRPS